MGRVNGLFVLLHDAGHVFLRDDVITVDIECREDISHIGFMNPSKDRSRGSNLLTAADT